MPSRLFGLSPARSQDDRAPSFGVVYKATHFVPKKTFQSWSLFGAAALSVAVMSGCVGVQSQASGASGTQGAEKECAACLRMCEVGARRQKTGSEKQTKIESCKKSCANNVCR